MVGRRLRAAPPGLWWFAAGAVFSVLGALMASGQQAREVAQVGWLAAIGFLVLILVFSSGWRRDGK